MLRLPKAHPNLEIGKLSHLLLQKRWGNIQMSRLHFSSVKSALKDLLNKECIKLPDEFLECFLKFISNACNYEEEGKKIRPHMVLGFNIDEAIIEVPNHSFIPLKKGEKNGSDLEKILKATIPFCSNGWIAYINIKEDYIEYGILRSFNGPKGLSATQVLLMGDEYQGEAEYGLIEISVTSSYELYIRGLKQNNLIVDFRLITDESYENRCNYDKMAQDIISDIKNKTEKVSLEKTFKNLLVISSQRIQGTICVVVKKDYKNASKTLSDGIWLSKPINLAKSALHTDKGTDCEKYYGLSGLLIEMMNLDGITIIDSQGRIKAFNVFINQAEVKDIKVGGGARKRAAYAILHTEDENILGVYFQSQDGNAFYERMSEFER